LWLLVSVDIVRAAHDRGLDVLTWTVNDLAAMRALVQQGVDGIISDFPERLRAAQVVGES
jgi:glycerophosphoryl diester phosphodiesterase